MNSLWNIAKFLKNRGGGVIGKTISRIFELLNYTVYSNHISTDVQIGTGTRFEHHGLGCVVHGKAVIGDNCRIYQNVTIGAKWPKKKGHKDGVPTIGNNVQVGAGAVILGPIHIGNNVSIGANAVVIQDVPDNSICVGVPARVITCKGDNDT